MGEYVALNCEKHLHLAWKPYPHYEFAAGDHAVPALLRELRVLVCHYTLAFIRMDAIVTPMVLQGIYPNKNHCVGADGVWMKPYVPRHYEFSPFRLARTQDDALVVGIDADCLVARGKNVEMDLFTEEGEPAERIRKITQGLVQQNHDLEQARRATAALAAHDLLVPWEPKITFADATELMLKGLYKVDEEKIASMDDNTAGELSRSNALFLAYCQLISMQHLKTLASQKTVSLHKPEFNFENFDRNDTISFKNL